jgi:hypothetical protein
MHQCRKGNFSKYQNGPGVYTKQKYSKPSLTRDIRIEQCSVGTAILICTLTITEYFSIRSFPTHMVFELRQALFCYPWYFLWQLPCPFSLIMLKVTITNQQPHFVTYINTKVSLPKHTVCKTCVVDYHV